MPKRFGTPGPRLMLPTICTSVPVSGCSVEAQLLFDRLIVQADDQGRMQGEPRVVAALCMPLIKRATEARTGRWLDELTAKGLVARYQSDGRELIQMLGWWDNQGTPRRAYPSRYPAPEGWTDRVRLDGEPPPEPPHYAANSAANRGQDDGPRARGSVPSLPVSPHPAASLPVVAGEDDGLKAENERRRALERLSEDYKAGKLNELDYQRQRKELAS